MRHIPYRATPLVWALTACLLSTSIFATRLFADANLGDSLVIVDLEPPRAGNVLESFSFRSLKNKLISWDESARSLKINDSALNLEALILHVFQPDCGKCKSLAVSLQALSAKYSDSNIFVLGIAHRKQPAESKAFAKKHDLTYPILVATDTEWGRRWGRGDAFYIVGSSGLVVYSQTGYNSSDPESWGHVVDDLIGSRRNLITEPKRKRFHVGDTLPNIQLPSLGDRSPMTLSVLGNDLSLTKAGAKEQKYRASIGFFSRF
ncbi:MAG: TlpA family protein disulfide reductase [candidate division Zixibacteria bacterium]|nr:TlpA family protein disulfide reductase [candidate division Zixibacteria bacterium]